MKASPGKVGDEWRIDDSDSDEDTGVLSPTKVTFLITFVPDHLVMSP